MLQMLCSTKKIVFVFCEKNAKYFIVNHFQAEGVGLNFPFRNVKKMESLQKDVVDPQK